MFVVTGYRLAKCKPRHQTVCFTALLLLLMSIPLGPFFRRGASYSDDATWVGQVPIGRYVAERYTSTSTKVLRTRPLVANFVPLPPASV